MIYVLQVRSSKEKETELFMEYLVEKTKYNSVYHPTRRMLRKRDGKWKEVTEKLLPGYIFVETEDPVCLMKELKRVPRLTKFIDIEDKGIGCEPVIRALNKRDENWLLKMMSGQEGQLDLDSKLRNEVGLTLVEIEDKNEKEKPGVKKGTDPGNKTFDTGMYRIHILEGPLKDMQGNIKKINLHRRRAEVEIDFMGQKTLLYMGIVIKE